MKSLPFALVCEASLDAGFGSAVNFHIFSITVMTENCVLDAPREARG
jgi:hypothetical protein